MGFFVVVFGGVFVCLFIYRGSRYIVYLQWLYNFNNDYIFLTMVI